MTFLPFDRPQHYCPLRLPDRQSDLEPRHTSNGCAAESPCEVFPMRYLRYAAVLSASSFVQLAHAQSPNDPSIEACRSTGLIALEQTSPSIKNIIFDMESLAVSKAHTDVGGVPVREVIMGDAYFEKKETGKGHRFVCLLGDKGKVLLTFFTSQ
jgi:hypothetical protein